MSDLSDPTALPTEPGHYLDKDGGYWCITEDGSLFDPADFETQTNGDPTQYAPFTRLFPAAHFAAEHERLKLDLATVEATAESQAVELDVLRAQIEEARNWCRENGAPGGYPKEPFTFEKGVTAAATDLLAILAQSPRGTVARIQSEAWAEGVEVALNHAIRNPDGITLRLEHIDGSPWVNPYGEVQS